MEESKEAACQ